MSEVTLQAKDLAARNWVRVVHGGTHLSLAVMSRACPGQQGGERASHRTLLPQSLQFLVLEIHMC